MAVVLPHGALFRGNAEEHIRKYLIKEKNILDAVIGLPTNLFYGTPIPTCILVFKKCRENPNDVLFIDSSAYFERGTQNVLRPSDVEKIITTYRDRTVVDKYSYVAPLSEIEENEYNLNIPRYVNTFEEEEIIDVSKVSTKLKALEIDMKETDDALIALCNELNIDTPF